MPKKSRSNLKPGKNAFSSHAEDPTEFAGGVMPGGINRGVARVTKCEFAKFKSGDNEGELYWIAVATGIEPEEAKGNITTLGPEPLCETTSQAGKTTTYDEHIGKMLNYMRQLGADTSEVQSQEDCEAIAQAIQDAAPFIRFSTREKVKTKQFPKGGAWHDWHGIDVDYEQTEEDDVQEDATDEVGELPEPGEPPPDDEVPFDSDDPSELAKAADEDDNEEAQTALTKMAEAAGCDQDQVDATGSWEDVADLIIKADENKLEAPANDPEIEIDPPTKGEVYGYRPPRARKDIDVEVTAVFPGKETCNVKGVESGRVYKAVPWDKLS